MRNVYARMAALGILGLALVATGVRAQDAKPAASSDSGVSRVEIYNGTLRTVHYYAPGASSRDQASYRDRAIAENNMALNAQLLNLRTQYLADERALQPQRKALLEQLIANNGSTPTGVYPDEVHPIDCNGTLAFADTYLTNGGYGYPYHAGYGYGYGLGNFLNGYPSWGGTSAPAASGMNGAAVALNALEESSKFKNAVVTAMVTQTSPDALAQQMRSYDNIMARTSADGKGIRPASFESGTGGAVTVTQKGGTAVKGSLVDEDNDWVTVDTGSEEVKIRKAEVISIARAKK